MAQDPRRFDQIEKVVRDLRRSSEDTAGTVLARLAAHTHAAYAALVHTHAESDVTSLVTDLAGKAASVHTHEPVDITAATLHEARYEHTSSMNFTTSTDTKIKFNSAVYTCSDVVASGTGNTDFALNRAGLWRVSAALRYNGNAGAGERHIFGQTGTTFNTANRFDAHTAVNVGSVPCTVTCSTDIRVTSGTSICFAGWQNCGATLGTDIGFGGTGHITMTWLRP